MTPGYVPVITNVWTNSGTSMVFDKYYIGIFSNQPTTGHSNVIFQLQSDGMIYSVASYKLRH